AGGKTAKKKNMELVSVQYEFEYKAKDGRLVSIKPNESYILLSKTNEHWWHVRKDQHTRPFYVPAQYVKELAAVCEVPNKLNKTESENTPDASKETYRFSTFGFCDDLPDVKPCETLKETRNSFSPTLDNMKMHSSTGAFSPPNTEVLELYAKPHPVSKVRNEPPESSVKDVTVDQPQICEEEDDFDFPLPPPLIYDTIPEIKITEYNGFSELDDPVPPPDEFSSQQWSVENANLRSAVYVNVAQLRQSISESPPSAPSSYSPSYLDPEGWEVHLDQDSGQEYYYHPATAEEPFSPSPPQSPALSQSTASPTARASDWEQLVDETSGRPYFYNPMSGETSWEPPEPLTADPPEGYEELLATGPPTLPKEFTLSHVTRTIIPRANLDRSTPAGWNLTVEPGGTWVFTSENSPDQWIKSVDDRGQTYYYLRDGSRSQWNLPEVKTLPSFTDCAKLMRFVPTHRRNTSDYSSDSSSTGNSPETQHNVSLSLSKNILTVKRCELPSYLNAALCFPFKAFGKNWTQTWTVLHGGVLTFHKDPKSAATGNKTNQIVPEVTVDLRGATIGWASKDKSSKKNVLELKGKNGVEFLIQYDTESIISDWHKVLMDTIRQLDVHHHSDEEDGDLYEKIGNTEPNVTHSSSSAGETDPKKVRTKLMKFLMKRPTLQSVKEKGYIRENVFGCHLATLCQQERTTVPRFVEKCVRAVEKRGLDIDGLYRVSGNLAVIQKLRYKADHEELDLEDGQWEDVHVITGALKLFFRELPEPLFPYSHFNKFISAIRIPDYNTKLSCIYELVRSLPPPNHDTMKLLFGHLHRVIQYGDDNRMTVQNVAIVFGPTLLRPEMESSNIAMHMVFQNQIVEFILNEYERIFHSS
uniref:Rho GTPase activating protein 27 n=1 Tax=Acanthochromis polyacanthus TaxID=80966 RepID=A0A3Q1G209_9TELE